MINNRIGLHNYTLPIKINISNSSISSDFRSHNSIIYKVTIASHSTKGIWPVYCTYHSMKKYMTYVIALIIALSTISCYTSKQHPHSHLPPGQAKKVYGDKSAKRHAPGQQKKKHKKTRHHKH